MRADADAEVLFNSRLSDDYCVIGFRAPALGAALQAGQFVMIRTSPNGAPLLRRPYSVFERLRGPDGGIIGFSIFNKRVGTGSGLLADARPGRHFDCLGPLGRPFSEVRQPSSLWMVAGGTGLAPFATLAESLVGRGVSLRLYYGARSESDLFCLDVFERFGIDITVATEDGTRGAAGRVTVPLERDLRSVEPALPVSIAACGPEGMLHAVARLAATHARPCEVATERQMGCGMGGCYSCVVKVRTPDGGTRFARSCIEGPVFDANDIVWG
jgi:dihydroorotate dehydrogenase electron transfer subunit